MDSKWKIINKDNVVCLKPDKYIILVISNRDFNFLHHIYESTSKVSKENFEKFVNFCLSKNKKIILVIKESESHNYTSMIKSEFYIVYYLDNLKKEFNLIKDNIETCIQKCMEEKREKIIEKDEEIIL